MEVIGYLLFLVIVIVVVRAIIRAGGQKERSTPTFTIEVSSSGYTYRDGDPEKESRNCWVSPGTPVSVRGYECPDGMVYVGKEMISVNGWGADPALINPKLSVARSGTYEDFEEVGYWPRYGEIAPSARAAYLGWLSGGRRDPDAPPGLVFLFFYGLERRLLFDTRTLNVEREEIAQLVQELKQLLKVYGESGSFASYASNLVAYTEAAHLGGLKLESIPAGVGTAWEVPFPVKVALGRRVANGEPIPADLALAWLKTHPELGLRTPARRCPHEFDELFRIRYDAQTRGGIKIKPNKTRIKLQYRPASSGNPEPPTINMDDLPDVTRLKAAARKLDAVSQDVQNELDAYSRWVGKTEDRTSAAAIGLLPPELISSRLGGEAKDLADWLRDRASTEGGSVIDTAELLRRWPSSKPGVLTKKEATSLAEFLSAIQIGIEPDVRLGRMNPTRAERLILFACEAGDEVQNAPALDSSTILLQLGIAVAAADGSIDDSEESKMEEHLEQALALSPHERVRLKARMKLMLAEPPSLAGLKKAFEGLSKSQRHQVARFALGIAAADGEIDPSEVKTLTRIYKMLGFDAGVIHSELHDLASGADRGLTTVLKPDSKDSGYGIPSAPKSEPEAVTLDMRQIEQIREDTREVASLLKGIFEGTDDTADDEGIDLDGGDEEDAPDRPAVHGGVAGLDEQHSDLVRVLQGRDAVPRSMFDELAGQHKLMAGGAIEVINEASFAVCDEPLIEGADPLEINQHALREMLP